ncbi:hypothetical protein TNCV_3887271 [Trichonephila clavipes]|nr:hypothetical protein TNCV_3887271 [Trichonephila clavipes]
MAPPPISTYTLLPWDWMGGKYSPVPCACDSAHKTFGPTDLTSTFSVCTRGYLVASGIQALRSGIRCPNHSPGVSNVIISIVFFSRFNNM